MKRINKTESESSIVVPEGMGDGFGGDQPDNAPEIRTFAPYFKLYHDMQPKAKDGTIKAAIDGPVSLGMPYVGMNRTFYRLDEAAFVLWGEPLYFWCRLQENSGRNLKEAWDFPKQWEKGEPKVHQSILCSALFIPGESDLPEALQPATLVSVELIKKHQSKAFTKHANEITKLKKNPKRVQALGGIATEVPAGVRLASTLRITPHGGGVPYAEATSVQNPITLKQYEAITAWYDSKEGQDQRYTVEEAIDRRRAEIQAAIAATAST